MNSATLSGPRERISEDDVIVQRHQASAGNKKGQWTSPLAFGLYRSEL